MDEDFDSKNKGRAVPRGRVSRLSQFGRLAGGVAGGVIAEGARRAARGESLQMRDLLLTPGNVGRVADRLADLRGAAMKLGQMISLDSGEILPPELTEVLARLRNQGQRMPPAQLNKVLIAEWGKDWRKRFRRFEASPMAAASIGQVHRAMLPDGRMLAIKVQFPGIAESIDADVDNVATLLRVSGLLPKELDISPFLEEAKAQLHEEADYLREGEQMRLYRERLVGRDDYVVPELVEELTTPSILAMTYVEGSPIESLETEDQAARDHAMRMLVQLVLDEFFAFGVMQTDPNFANYRWQAQSKKLVLLDFGATRTVSKELQRGYAKLLRAGLANDRDRVRDAAVAAGFMGPEAVVRHPDAINRMIDIILKNANAEGPFDFGDRSFVGALREEGMRMAEDKAIWHLPPPEILFVQRKISGTAWLAARLKAKVDVRSLVAEALGEPVA